MAELGATGETLSIDGHKRIINYGAPDPEIIPISYADAVQVLKSALAGLPNIPQAPAHIVLAPHAQPPHRQWSLALDEQHETGFALRPMLPFHGQPTGPDVLRVAMHALAAAPIGPVPLDEVSVPDDSHYATRINSQMNIPAAIKDGLKTYYPI
jgi:hypothetical protein